MKILSIDVGIKNLAYCFLNYENEQLDILSWDVIDMCREKNWICKQKKKNKDYCNKQAKYFKNNIYYCKVHAKQTKFLIPTENIIKIKNKIKKNKITIKLLKNFLIDNHLLDDLSSKEISKLKKEKLIELFNKYINKHYLDNIEKINTNTFICINNTMF